MPGFAELTPRVGFAAHTAARPGFAALLDGSTSYARPSVGLFADLKAYEDRQAQAVKPRKPKATRPTKSERPEAKTYDFPAILLGRRLNVREATDWEKYEQQLERQNHYGARLGTVVSHKELMVLYFQPVEINNALVKRYSKVARLEAKASARRSIAEEKCNQIQDMVLRLQMEEDEGYRQSVLDADIVSLRLQAELGNDRGLTYDELRLINSDYEAYDKEDLADQMLLTKPDRLWRPSPFKIGNVSSPTPSTLGFEVVDQERIMRNERQQLISGFVQELDFSKSCFSRDWLPEVVVVETDHTKTTRSVTLPAAPIDLPLRQPAAYMDR